MKLFILSAAMALTAPLYAGIMDEMGGAPEVNSAVPAPVAVAGVEFPQGEPMPEGIPGSQPPAGAQPTGCRARFIEIVRTFIGKPYVSGGADKAARGVDCSGLVVASLKELNASGGGDCPRDRGLLDKIVGARDTYHIQPILPRTELKDLKPGDLVFSDYGYHGKAGPGHMFIFLEQAGPGQAKVLESGGLGDRNVAEEVRPISGATFASLSAVFGE